MKRSLVIGGCLGIGVLLILVAFTSVVNAQTTKTTLNDMISDVITKKSKNEKIQTLQPIKKLTTNEEWFPGQFLGTLFVAFLTLLWYLTKWLISPHN
jgi:hypothetical protein